MLEKRSLSVLIKVNPLRFCAMLLVINIIFKTVNKFKIRHVIMMGTIVFTLLLKSDKDAVVEFTLRKLAHAVYRDF